MACASKPALRIERGLGVSRLAAAIGLVLALSAAGESRADDFNPEGRKRRPASGQRSPGATPKRTPAVSPRPASPAGPTRTPTPGGGTVPAPGADSTAALIDRYQAILDRDPGADFPLERLVSLYRQRDGNLDALVRRYEELAARGGADARRARLSLAGVYVHAGDKARAEALYEQLLAESPRDDLAARKLAGLLAERGDKASARARLEPTLAGKLPDVVREQTLRSLIAWSLDLSDLVGARKHHEALVTLSQNSFFVRAELGRLLMERRMWEPAEAEYRRLVQSARGDSRALGPALRDLGQALRALGKHDEALATLREAERHVPRTSGLRLELLKLEVEVYRAAEKLPELVARLEKEGSGDPDQLVLLGGLSPRPGRSIERGASTKKRSHSGRARSRCGSRSCACWSSRASWSRRSRTIRS